MEFLKEIYDKVEIYYETKADPRTTNWFLMESPLPVLAISLIYMVSVQVSRNACVLDLKLSLERARGKIYYE